MTAPEVPGPDPAPADWAHDALIARLRATFDTRVTRPLPWRRQQLEGLAQMLTEREDHLLGALAADLSKPAIEGWTTELRHVANEVRHIRAHLSRWAAPTRVAVRPLLQPARARIVAEPLGVVLVIAPWNYPVHLLVLPLAYALAAGNAAVAKPSEVSAHTSAALARWLPQYVDPEAVAVVEGDAAVVTSLLEQRWDHIFYTGNGRVGRIVAAAAALHLTPTTLELGGKCPVIIDRHANLDVAARRVTWGKFVNAGQTCIAPDYVLVDREVEAPFLDGLGRALRDFYGPDPRTSPDYGRLVNERHFDRLAALIDAHPARDVVYGGDRARAERYVAPTVLRNVSWDQPVMSEEIFGPILPVLAVSDIDDAIATVNAHEHPLALYVFSEQQAIIDRVVDQTVSGGVCANATLIQVAVPGLPFGGVGESGMGAYHGRAGFETFSHRKAVLQRGTRVDPPVMYPPYTRVKQWIMRKAV